MRWLRSAPLPVVAQGFGVYADAGWTAQDVKVQLEASMRARNVSMPGVPARPVGYARWLLDGVNVDERPSITRGDAAERARVARLVEQSEAERVADREWARVCADRAAKRNRAAYAASRSAVEAARDASRARRSLGAAVDDGDHGGGDGVPLGWSPVGVGRGEVVGNGGGDPGECVVGGGASGGAAGDVGTPREVDVSGDAALVLDHDDPFRGVGHDPRVSIPEPAPRLSSEQIRARAVQRARQDRALRDQKSDNSHNG